jgi:hypothetical protein
MAPRPMSHEGDAWETPLRAAFSQIPKSLKAPLMAQICQFVYQSEFLRRSLHVQLELTHKNCLEVVQPQADVILQHSAHTTSPETEAQLCQVFSLVNCITPALAKELSTALQIGHETISEWFSKKSTAMDVACRQLAKIPRPQKVVKGAKSSINARGLAPRTVLPATFTAGEHN